MAPRPSCFWPPPLPADAAAPALPRLRRPQPKKIEEIKKFLLTARRKDARSVKIKKSGDVTKFKVRAAAPRAAPDVMRCTARACSRALAAVTCSACCGFLMC